MALFLFKGTVMQFTRYFYFLMALSVVASAAVATATGLVLGWDRAFIGTIGMPVRYFYFAGLLTFMVLYVSVILAPVFSPRWESLLVSRR